MVNINSTTLVGNTTREPEIRYTPGGASVAEFGLAVNRRWLNKQTQEWEEQVSFFDVTCWGSLAENVSSSLAKGANVVVVGRLEQQTWEDNEGNNRSKVKITAQSVGPNLEWATAEVTKVSGKAPKAAAHNQEEEPF